MYTYIHTDIHLYIYVFIHIYIYIHIDDELEELEVPIVYARQCLKRHVIQEGTQDGACLWTLAKQAAMAKVPYREPIESL